MYVTITELAGQLGTTTEKLLTACRALGFDLGGGWSLISVEAFNEAIAAKKAELAAVPVDEEPEEPYFSAASAEAMVAETNQALALRSEHTARSRFSLRRRAS